MVMEEKDMSIKYLSAMVFVFAIFTACNKYDRVGNIEKTFYAVNEPHSRTVLNNKSILWESEDEIKVFWGNDKSSLSAAKVYNSGQNATFTATVGKASAYYGVYPSSAVSSMENDILKVAIPEDQTGIFADVNFAVSKADDQDNMFFKHVVSWLEFTIDKTGILTFTSAKGTPLTGIVSIKEFDKDGMPVYDVTGGSSVVRLNIKCSGTYYIALLPDVKIDGLSFTLVEDIRPEYIFSSNAVLMSPGKLVALGNITGRFGYKGDFGAANEVLVDDSTIVW